MAAEAKRGGDARRSRGDGVRRPRVVVVPDGMADEPLPELGGCTALQTAWTPAMDSLARGGVVGLVRTVPTGMPAGSDVANLSVLGYDPRSLYTGRAPIEAASMGIELAPSDVAYRCNLVTVADGIMRDHTAGQIPTAQADVLIRALAAAFADSPFEFHPGLSYRHLMVWHGGETADCTPPHDILDRPVGGYFPRGPAGAVLREVMRRSHEVLGRLRPGTDIWLWGEGRAPHLPPFAELWGLKGAVIAAVDLVRGLGVCAGLDVVSVPGGTGDLETDYAAKGRAALAALADYGFVFVHIEAPDEAAHMGDARQKVTAIERIDEEIVAPLYAAGAALLVLPDHYTPVRIRTHADSPVPFVYGVSGVELGGPTASVYDEAAAAGTGLTVADGPELISRYLEATA